MFFRRPGIVVVLYIDGILVWGNSYKDCKRKVQFILRFLKKLRFLINMEMRTLDPDRKVIYIGFECDIQN